MLRYIFDMLLGILLFDICCFLFVISGSYGKCRVYERINICGISCFCCEKEETCVYSCKGSLIGGYNYVNI